MTKKIDYSLIEQIPADEVHREFSYQVKKASLGEYITQIWGWDEVMMVYNQQKTPQLRFFSTGIKRGEAPLRNYLPLPLVKGRGTKGEGLI